MIALTCLALYIFIFHLSDAIKRKQLFPSFYFSVFAFFVFCSLALITAYSPTSLTNSASLLYLRFQLLFLSLAGISWFVYVYSYYQLKKKYLLAMLIVILAMITLACLVLPRVILLSGMAGLKESDGAVRMGIIYQGQGFILWRVLMDLAVILLSLGSLILILTDNDRKRESFRSLIIFLLLLLLISGLNDHLADYGLIRSIHIVPYALFLLMSVVHIHYLRELHQTERSTKRLFEDARDWWQVFNRLEMVVVGLDRMGNVAYVNPYLLKITGYTNDELVGKDWFDMAVPPKFAYEVQSAFLEIIDRNAHQHYSNPIVSKNDEEIGVFWYNIIIYEPQGRLTGTLSIGVDEKNYKREDTSLENALAEAQKLADSFRNEMQQLGKKLG